MGAAHVSIKELLQKMPIYWPIKNFIPFQILQSVSVIRKYLRDFERAYP